jgi:hypothetical protein
MRIGGSMRPSSTRTPRVPSSLSCASAPTTGVSRVELDLPGYEKAHLLPNTFVVLTGHPRIENAETVEEHALFDVVQKTEG